METGFALTAFLAVVLNLILPEEIEDEEIPELTANDIDSPADQAEWNRIRRKSQAVSDDSITNAEMSKGANDGIPEGEKRRLD